MPALGAPELSGNWRGRDVTVPGLHQAVSRVRLERPQVCALAKPRKQRGPTRGGLLPLLRGVRGRTGRVARTRPAPV